MLLSLLELVDTETLGKLFLFHFSLPLWRNRPLMIKVIAVLLSQDMLKFHCDKLISNYFS